MKTKTVEEFLSYLCSLDVKLWVEDNRLRCKAPKDALTSVVKQELAERKEDILAFIRNNNVTDGSDRQLISKVPRKGNLPLSFAQQRLWFVEQLTQVSQVFDVPIIASLKGSLNIAALQCAINELVRRHEILRTSFTSVEGQPVQIVHPTLSLSLPVVDLQGLTEAKREIEIQRVINNVEASQLFNLSEIPLLCCFLIRSNKEEHILLCLIHHIITDGWSVGVFSNELTVLYEAFCQNQPSPLPELPIQYADFAVWQRQYLQGKVLDNLLTYWKQKLSGNLPILQLPTDHPRPAIQTFSGKRKSFFLSQDLTRGLKALNRNEDATLFMTLLAAFKTLLHRYSSQDDILVGSPIANRNQNDTEQLIGFFVNTLVLRTGFSGDPSFQELLKHIRETTLGAYAHQDMPFELLVDELQPQRNLSYTPLFQVLFVLHNVTIPALEMADVIFESVVNDNIPNVMFDLVLHATEREEGIDAALDYNADLFEENTICRMVDHLQKLLEGIVANPQQRLSELPLLRESEQHQLLREWNNTEAEYPLLCIHELFEAQVEKTPDAIAVVFEEQQLTYCELNAKVNQLAHHLRSLGVKAEVLVGICVERSLDMVIGLLAILKAGGAYVPLDPNYPQERLVYMLEDSQPSVLLTQQYLLESLPPHKAQVICIDSNWEQIASSSTENPASNTTIDNLAYVIYTSGSTGKPKGVMNSHSGICNRLLWMQDTYQLTSADAVLQKTPFSFDVSVWEFFWTLITGARLVVAQPEGHRDPNYLVNLIRKQQVTTLHFVPSMLQAFLEAEGLEKCQSLVRVIASGEALPAQLQERFFNRLNAQLHNLYGPTEAAVDVTYWQCNKDKLSNQNTVPIGQPIANIQIYILDKYLKPVPMGVTGEVYIGGVGVARGYLNRPDLSAEKFIPNPFSIQATRLYKTGDLARYLPSGDIEYIGRIDNQVKVRGFRIELGEIEAVISQYPAVRETVVVVREDSVDSQRIIAYVVAQTEQTLAISQLRSFLESNLPNYMVPAAFVTLEALPLTPNGKVDRKALPAHDNVRPELEEVLVEPSTKEEKILAKIWAEVLGLEQVGIHDNFFSLGGDSIHSIQVQYQAQKHGLNFSIQQLFRFQTIYQLLGALKTGESLIINLEKSQPFSLISQEDKHKLPECVEDAYPLTILQRGMVFHSEYSPEKTTYHDVFSYHLQAPLKIEALQTAIQILINRHPILRTSFELNKFTEPLQLVHQNIDILLQVEDWHHFSTSEFEDALNAWLDREKRQHFDWSIPPLLRFFVHQCTEQTFYLTVSFHHAILDGWSVASMLNELFGQYFSLLNEKADFLELPPLSLFRDFVALERETIISDESQRYWIEKLHDKTITTLPRWNFIPQGAKVKQVIEQEVPISAELSQGLQQLAQSTGIPLKSVLLAAHLRVLNLLCGQSDILTGVVTNGRLENQDGDRTLGLFLNTVPFRLKLSGGTWVELAQEVFKVEQEWLPHRRYPLAEIQRNLGGLSLFETIFNFTRFHAYQAVLEDKNVQSLGGKFYEETNFPLTADFSQDPSSFLLTLSLRYDASEFCLEQIKCIGEYYDRTLQAIVNDSRQRYELHELLSAKERHQLVVEWNNTQTYYPSNQCIHELFEFQVERTPDAVAVVFEDEQLTYSELNAKANQLAHYLQQLGVKPEVLVGICVERSLDMVIGLLAILKAGGAYVPLDPNYPQERLAYMLEDSQPSVLLTQQYLLESLPPHKAQVICIDSGWEQIASESTENPASNTTIDNLAYVIYTSGSTGKPKGVMNSHSGICNRLLWMQDTYQLTSADAVLQKTPFSFDVSVWEFFWTLITGARLVVAQPEGHRDPNYLVNLIRKQQVTTLHFVPSMLQAFLEAEGLEKCQSLVRVIASGEALPAQLQERFFNRLNAQLHNLYGPTEAAVDVTYWQCNKDKLSNQNTVPIGQPIANIQIYILDKYLKPVPMGVTGEVYIGGVGVARGYLNRPDLSAEKFIPNPFSIQATRLYKTGDLARYLPSGDIEYIGRIDNQVKVRGFRIELGEIEAVISQHPAVRETSVVVREDSVDSQRIIAYVVAQTEQTLAISQLRSFLESNLPNYMVPAAFVTLEALPLTPNGKVDRKALPAPDTLRPELEETYVAPQTTVEKQLATIWKEILGLGKIGIHDNFFELGGDSILSLQIVSKANQAGLYLTPKQIFQYQTIAQLVTVIGTTEKIQAEQGVLSGTLELIPIQQWFFEQKQPQAHHWNQAVFLENKQNIDPTVLEKILESLLKHHDVLRLRFKQTEFSTQAFIASPDDTIPLTYLDFSVLPKDKQATAIEAAANKLQASLNLSQGPLFRVVHFKLGDNQPNRLLWIIHHLAVDGVSWRVLIEDFQTAYQQISQGEAIELPPKTTSYKQWSSRIQEYAQSSELLSEIDFWLATQYKSILPIPRDFPDGNNIEETTSTVSVSLSVEETQSLVQQVPAAYHTQINDVLLTALALTFNQWTGENSLLINLEGHGREGIFEDVDLSRTVGWFTTIFPVHLNLENANDLGEALKLIKEQLRAIPNRGIGYGLLRYLSQDKEIIEQFSSSKSEIAFNYLGQFDQVLPESSLFSLAQESSGFTTSLQNKRTHLLEINCGIYQKNLEISWSYSNKLHRRITIEELAQSFIKTLRSLIAHCQSPDAGGFTSSDFAEFKQSQWDQSDLDAITAAIGGI